MESDLSEEEKIMPSVLYSAEAEKAVLGCMLAYPAEVMDDVTESLTHEDFFVPSHREIFLVMCEMNWERKHIDIMTVHQNLSDRGKATDVGSPGILAELGNAFATHLNLVAYTKTVRDKSLLRRLMSACREISQDVSENPEDIQELADRAERRIFRAVQVMTPMEAVPMNIIADRAYQRIVDRKSRHGLVGLPTGFHRLDQLTGGWKAGEMIVLAARPGVGKTALGMKFMMEICSGKWDQALGEDYQWVEPGNPCAFFSIEMTEEQLSDRIYSVVSSVAMERIRAGVSANERDLLALDQSRMRIKRWPMFIDDSPYLTINGLRSRARRLKSRHDIKALGIDYLQLMKAPGAGGRHDNRQQEVAEISSGIKQLAKELGIPIIILAQLNRKTEDGKGTEPQLHNLRESGAIEQDADVVLLLHRVEQEEDEVKGSWAPRPYKLNLAKQRNGPTDKLDITLHGAYTRFDDQLRHELRQKEPQAQQEAMPL